MTKKQIKNGLFSLMGTFAYIRTDKDFYTVVEQLQAIYVYALSKGITIHEEFIDQVSKNKRIDQRSDVVEFFHDRYESRVLVYDVGVLSLNIEDLTQMFSCLMKHHFEVHFIKQGVVMTNKCNGVFVLGLLDQVRNANNEIKRNKIGRPKGSQSNSKFDKFIQQILEMLRQEKTVSEIARVLHVSRSSLKDYVESRNLKELAFANMMQEESEKAHLKIENSIVCPNMQGDGI